MAVWDPQVLCSLLLLLLPAAGCQLVQYPAPVCAMKGSTVTLPCSFRPLPSVTDGGQEVRIQILRVVWCRNHPICQGSTPSVYDSQSGTNDPRYRYLGDMSGTCTLRITELQRSDQGTLRFRMEATHSKGHFTARQGVNVTVIDGSQMSIRSSSNETETVRGENVTLLCSALCTFHQLELTWSRDGHALPQTGPALRLGPLTAEDSGNYTCRLKGRSRTESRPYRLQVEAAGTAPGVAGVSTVVGVGGVVGGVLLLLALFLVACFIKRRRAAAEEEEEEEEEEEHKPSDEIYSNVAPVRSGGGASQQEVTADEVSYAAVHFKQQQACRAERHDEDAVIYSSVASRG